MEGAIHVVCELFDQHCDDGWRVLFVDARNAFIPVNRVECWFRCSCFLFNTYQGHAKLFVHGSDQFLLSKEGVTEGDPLSMILYAVTVLSLKKTPISIYRIGMLMIPHVLESYLQ